MFYVINKIIYIKTIPIIQVFTYKTNINRYLIRFKDYLYTRGNLQELVYKDIYTATLAARLFRALIAIIVIFNLDYQQGNAINIFANSKINKVVYIKYPDRFLIKGKCLLL